MRDLVVDTDLPTRASRSLTWGSIFETAPAALVAAVAGEADDEEAEPESVCPLPENGTAEDELPVPACFLTVLSSDLPRTKVVVSIA